MFHANSLRAALFLSTAVAAVTAAPAWAQSQSRAFDIPAQGAATGVPAFAEQADVQILVAEGDTRGRRTQAVRGTMTVSAGLERLLAGSGLVVVSNDGRTITLGTRAQAAGVDPAAATEVDEIIVTAQKREERIQDVPIAITALSEETLEAQQIEGGFDLLRAVPNVTFSKSNYSSYNFSIRGVGTKAVSATSDPGVAVAFNNIALIRNRLFEQEYLDITRVEVLRGPQGTLYGRNATAGVVNIITAQPELGLFESNIGFEIGNYDSRRLTGMINVPLGETAAFRFAAASTQRDGYGINLKTDEDVDGRDLWTTRATLAWEPTDRFRTNLIWERFEEDDNRLRTGKQLCNRDDGPETMPGVVGPIDLILRGRLSQGCKPGSLYGDEAFGSPNGLSIPFIAGGQLLIPLGWHTPTADIFGPRVMALNPGIDPYDVEQNRDLRAIESMFAPEYRASADILALTVEFDLTDSLTLTSQTAYNKDEVWSFQDYNRFATRPVFNESRGLYNTLVGGDPNEPSVFADLTPGGIFTDPQIGPSDTIAGFEISSSESEQFSQEFRLQSAFDGAVNFSLGANYTRFEALNDYYLFFNMVTLIAQGFYNRSADPTVCHPGASQCMYIDPNPLGSVDGRGHNYFRNKNPYEMTSTAAFGELYWEAAPGLKFTGGLRYTVDEKTFTPWRSQLMVDGDDYGPEPTIHQRWRELTGRVGVDWSPVLSFTDDTLVYAFWSHGYKGGGANPPPAVPPTGGFPAPVAVHPSLFDPEYVDAFEIGTKNTLLEGSMTLNLSAFHYDYTGYQVSKVVDRTIVNENFDAKIWGVEMETLWRPTDRLRLNASVGYLQTRVADGERSIDIFNRTQGRDDWMLVGAWIQGTSNCILPTSHVADLVNQGFPLPEPYLWAAPLMLACNIYANPGDLGFDRVESNNGAGFAADLSGHELPNSPEWTISLGAQYAWDLPGGWEARLRGDYYWQAESFARVYNLPDADRLQAWDTANLSFRIERPDDALALELYVKNVFDATPITDAFLNSDSTGMTTNVFTLDPRLIGFSMKKGF